MINYDKIDQTNWINLIRKTKPIRANDIYQLYRRGQKSDIERYITNDWIKIASKSNSVIFRIKNKEELYMLSKSYGRIYPLGVYFNGSIRLGICFDTSIKNALTPDRILLEMGPHKIGKLELEINRKILRNQDKLIKYTMTPYWQDGKFHPTNPMSPLKMF
jgi:hypothetical protein